MFVLLVKKVFRTFELANPWLEPFEPCRTLATHGDPRDPLRKVHQEVSQGLPAQSTSP